MEIRLLVLSAVIASTALAKDCMHRSDCAAHEYCRGPARYSCNGRVEHFCYPNKPSCSPTQYCSHNAWAPPVCAESLNYPYGEQYRCDNEYDYDSECPPPLKPYQCVFGGIPEKGTCARLLNPIIFDRLPHRKTRSRKESLTPTAPPSTPNDLQFPIIDQNPTNVTASVSSLEANSTQAAVKLPPLHRNAGDKFAPPVPKSSSSDRLPSIPLDRVHRQSWKLRRALTPSVDEE